MSPQSPRDYWADLSTRALVEGYLIPHASKLESEGLYVGAIAIREAIRRLQEIDGDPR